MKRKNTREWIGRVRSNVERGRGYRVMTLDLPARFPSSVGGEFIMLSVGGEPDILLRRPMAIYDQRKKTGRVEVDLLYSIVGRGTARMSQLTKGTELSLLGVIGNSFSIPARDRKTVVVAGGVGIAPFLLWGKSLQKAQKKNVRILFGFRNRDQLAIVRDFRATEIRPLCAVEGGGGDFRGTAIDLLEKEWKNSPADEILTCGPEKMLDRVIDFGKKAYVPVSASLETKMGCGMGVCLSCVTPHPGVHTLEGYSLVCQDGAIFTIPPSSH